MPKKKVSKTQDEASFPKMIPGQRSIEQLSHFWCIECKKWWSIGDAPKTKKDWFCPWCGLKQVIKDVK